MIGDIMIQYDGTSEGKVAWLCCASSGVNERLLVFRALGGWTEMRKITAANGQ